MEFLQQFPRYRYQMGVPNLAVNLILELGRFFHIHHQNKFPPSKQDYTFRFGLVWNFYLQQYQTLPSLYQTTFAFFGIKLVEKTQSGLMATNFSTFFLKNKVECILQNLDLLISFFFFKVLIHKGTCGGVWYRLRIPTYNYPILLQQIIKEVRY